MYAIPNGYRLLNAGEPVRSSDEVLDGTSWLPVAEGCPEGGQHRRMTVITAGEDGQPVVADETK